MVGNEPVSQEVVVGVVRQLTASWQPQVWPPWARRAAARLLCFFVPRLKTRQWESVLQSAEPFAAIERAVEPAWLLGRVNRFLAELKEAQPEMHGWLTKGAFVRQFAPAGTHISEDTDVQIENLFRSQLMQATQLPLAEQKKFWKAFNEGFQARLAPRRQDVQALSVYLLILFHWPRIELECRTLKEVFQFEPALMPTETCPSGVDPVDFEDRRWKWFEKLCQRNLGMSLSRKGRPAGKRKIPQSPTALSVLPPARVRA